MAKYRENFEGEPVADSLKLDSEVPDSGKEKVLD